MNFVKADITSIETLRGIAHYSEAYWGYDQIFMDIFDTKFNITEDFILKNPVFTGIEENNIVCFWGAMPNGNSCELKYFYIAAKYINTGLGKIMWQHFVSWCHETGIVNGKVLSLIDNCFIPSFIYVL